MPDAPTPLDLDAIRAMLGDRLAVTTRSVALDLLAEVERLRAEVARLEEDLSDRTMDLAEMTHPDRPAPAWDEDAVRADALDAVTTTVRMVLADVPEASADVIARNVTRALLAHFTITPKED